MEQQCANVPDLTQQCSVTQQTASASSWQQQSVSVTSWEQQSSCTPSWEQHSSSVSGMSQQQCAGGVTSITQQSANQSGTSQQCAGGVSSITQQSANASSSCEQRSQRTTNVRANDHIRIASGLTTGSQVVVRGRVNLDAGRFHINLRRSHESGSDIIFHFNPRIDNGNVVVRNTMVNGAWQTEERDTPSFPFNNGQMFTIRIMVMTEYYRVLVNNTDYIRYKHRISPDQVCDLHLSEGAEYYEASVQNSCRAPHQAQFPGGMKIGQSVRVRGMVKEDAQRFQVNFSCDKDSSTIGMHFNPRQDQFDVVLNSKFDGSWGAEQRGFGISAFQRGQLFDLFFIATQDKFCVFVNEMVFTTYDYRCSCSEIHYLNVVGDVDVMDVEILDPLPTNFVKEVSHGMEENDQIVVKGFLQGDKNVAVNLIKGHTLEDDIALHVRPRFDQNATVLNSRVGGAWQQEERHALPCNMHNPVPFEIEILTKSNHYQIFANDRKIANFNARYDIKTVKSIGLWGDAFFYETKLLRCVEPKSSVAFPGPLQPGNWVVITGVPDDDVVRFSVNFMVGPTANDDNAFHFDCRFRDQVVVRNTRVGGTWQHEERGQQFYPFRPADRFELAICVMQSCFRVFVNRQFYTDYKHRLDISGITHLYLTDGCDFFEPEFY